MKSSSKSLLGDFQFNEMFKNLFHIFRFFIPIALCIWMMYPLHGMVLDCTICDPLGNAIILNFVLIFWVLFISIYSGVVFSKKLTDEKEKKYRLQRYLIMILSIIGIIVGTYTVILYESQQRSKIYYKERKNEYKIEQEQLKLKIDSLKNKINKYPDSAHLYFDLGLELRHQGMWKYEVQILKRGILIDSTNSDCHLELANIYGHFYNNYDLAIKENKLGLRHMRTNPQWVIDEIKWLEELKNRNKK